MAKDVVGSILDSMEFAVVCNGLYCDDCLTDLSESIQDLKSNFGLYQASPDLLEALEEFMANWGSIHRSDMEFAVRMGRAAIAKAKGEHNGV